MTDDTIIRPRFGSRPVGYEDRDATCTGHVPSEASDAPHLRLEGLRKPSGKPVRPDAIEALGLGKGLPYSEGSTRVGNRTLRELRDRCKSLADAGADLEAAGCMIKTEARTLVRRLSELLGDDDNPSPKGAA